MSSNKCDDLFVNFLNISSSNSDSTDTSSEKCISEISASSVSTENFFYEENIESSKKKGEEKCTRAYDAEKVKKISNSDLENEITSNYIRSILKNKEKQKFYEFRKYLSDNDVFLVFVQIFLHLIKNKEKIKNPYDYIINYFKLKRDNYDNENKKVLKEENIFYKKENEKLNNKINLLEVEIYDIQKKNCCNTITKILFKDDHEKYNTCDLFNRIAQNNKKFEIEPSFIFTKDTFFLFLNFLSDSYRTKLYDILIQKACEQNYSSFYDKLLKKLTKFINYYSTFDKSSLNEHLKP